PRRTDRRRAVPAQPASGCPGAAGLAPAARTARPAAGAPARSGPELAPQTRRRSARARGPGSPGAAPRQPRGGRAACSMSSTDDDPPRLRAGFARHLWIDPLARLRVLDAPEMHDGPLLFHYADSQIAAISPYKSENERTGWPFVYQDERSRQRDRC